MILEHIIVLLKGLDERLTRMEERQVRIEMKLDSVQLLPPTKLNGTKLYAVSTAAKMLGVSPATVRRYTGDDQVVNVEKLRGHIELVRGLIPPFVRGTP